MRVEQRIGRIDRIGQRYNEVTILNYSYEDPVETDIYERLDDRISLFENGVGDMQPILSDVSDQIRSATLEADRDEGREAVEHADREFSEQIDRQERDDRVEVGESLDTVDDSVAQDVIDEAKLDAWQSFEHPDIVDVGAENYKYTPPFVTKGLEQVFVINDVLSDTFIEFTAMTNLDFDDAQYGDGSVYNDRTYRLELGGAIQSPPEMEEEGTLTKVITPEESAIAVTFSKECADEFPSIHYLALGNPLLSRLVEVILAENGGPERLTKLEETGAEYDPPVVCGEERITRGPSLRLERLPKRYPSIAFPSGPEITVQIEKNSDSLV